MAYCVEVAKNAEAELEKLYLWVIARAPQQASKRFNSLERTVLSLDEHPKRCPVALESIDPNHPVRVLSYGRKPYVYRILFTVDDETNAVRVVHVRRCARRRPIGEELRGESRTPSEGEWRSNGHRAVTGTRALD